MPDTITTVDETPQVPRKISGKAYGTSFEFDLSNPDDVATLTKLVEKGKGADEAFRQAAETKRKAEELLQQAGEHEGLAKSVLALRTAESEDERSEAFLNVARAMNMNRTEAIQLWKVLYPGDGDADDSDEETPAPSRTSRTSNEGNSMPTKIDYAQLPPEVVEAAAFIAKLKKQGVVDPVQALQTAVRGVDYNARERSAQNVKTAILANPALRAVRKRGPEAVDKLVRKATSELERRIAAGEAYQDALANSIAEIADTAQLVTPPQDDLTSVFGAGEGPVRSRARIDTSKQPQIDRNQLGNDDALASVIDHMFAHEDARNEDQDLL